MAPRAIIVCALDAPKLQKMENALRERSIELRNLNVGLNSEHPEEMSTLLSSRYTEFAYRENVEILRVCLFIDLELWLSSASEEFSDDKILVIIDRDSGNHKNSDFETALNQFKAFCADVKDLRARKRRYFQIIAYGDFRHVEPRYCKSSVDVFGALRAGRFGLAGKLVHIDDTDEKLADAQLQKHISWLLEDSDPTTDGSACEKTDSDVADVESFCDADHGSGITEMLSAKQRAALTKQGYSIIGRHSAVKLCRWTKAQLRGNGGCYKHTFYGLQSHQCMEATCCLACANKCIFCWRHQTNPTGTHWKWEADSADYIVEQALIQQTKLLNSYKGAQGVAEKGRYSECLVVAHCALSLVGEPLMYPHLNSLLRQLHDRSISTFLVNNGQFPDQLQTAGLCTQLYVSVDAADPGTLRDLGRPLHRDYWDRFLKSLSLIKTRPERTIYRLTIVKGHNNLDAEAYANLVILGKPDFIEIKGVTYTGVGCGIRMTNVPTHEDVREFSELLKLELEALNLEYGLAAEHKHSCSILLAHSRYQINGVWHTWIDFKKFFELEKQYYRSAAHFDKLEYSLPTPDWARYGSVTEGFDPDETRNQKVRKHTNNCGDCQIWPG